MHQPIPQPTQPIYTARSPGKKLLAIDLRTLPEEVKLNIIRASLGVAFHYGNGSYECAEGTSGSEWLDQLSAATDQIEPLMHEVDDLAEVGR